MRIPTSTYRIQFHAGFDFEAARQIVPYLKALGISDVYASPIFRARKGSTHGYDVVDPGQINPELGGSEKFEELWEALNQQQMGWIQDIVPNHMAYDGQNQMLMDVLESGPNSDFIDYFDVNWNHSYLGIQGRILAPFLGDFYDKCLESGQIQLRYDADGLSINYYTLKFPLNIDTYADVFTYNLSKLRRKLGRSHPDYIKLLGILFSLKFIPSKEDLLERTDQINFAKHSLWELYTSSQPVQNFFDENIDNFNGKPGDPSSFDLLDDLLARQNFRISFWKVGAEEINYRRFFTINELISLRIEDREVFRKTHQLILRLVEQGRFTGLRIDHIDGLFNPEEYLHRLRERCPETYIVVEKILESEESLPKQWPVQGTTGYDFLIKMNAIFCQTKHAHTFDSLYHHFTKLQQSPEQIIEEKKRLIIERNLSGDMDNLAFLLKQITSHHRYANDFTLYSLRRALVEVLVCFPVYRVYIREGVLESEGQQIIRQAVEQAKENLPILVNELNFIERFLCLEFLDNLSEQEKEEQIYFAMRLQQLAGPLMAKGVEDTAFYVYNRLLSLNEVGGNPCRFGLSVQDFHPFNQERAAHWPLAMNASATHDTKRGEDTRARLNVLSEIPDEWERHIKLWHELNANYKVRSKKAKRSELPDRNDEYSLYQTLLGSYPFQPEELPEFVQRVKEYMIKAVREAKVHTAWLRPDTDYEEATTAFIDQILQSTNPFLESFLPFQRKIAHFGIFNSLSQTLVKLTSPGIPDIYQGTELWDLSMVDPDNRRPVDFSRRLAYLEEIQRRAKQEPQRLIEDLLLHRSDGRIKLFLLRQALKMRQEQPQLFHKGEYTPLQITGSHREHVVAFARHQGKQVLITVVPRLLTQLINETQDPFGEAIWKDTQIHLPRWKRVEWVNELTNEEIPAGETISTGLALNTFPVAMLYGQSR
ncbi:MAG: malto-oligosyltrehalose synthase [Thermostichus sp. DG02_5_bins_236]